MTQRARRYIEIEVDAADALRTLRGIEDASQGTERALTGLQRQFRALGDAFKGFLGFLGAQQLIGFADAATDIGARLLAVTETAQESEVVFQELLDITGKLGVGITELGQAYAQLAVALPERSTQEIILALDTVSTVLATTGASAQQVNAVLLQLNQALGSATLQGDELRSVYENAPVLLKAWQEAADLTTQSIKELSAAGAFTTESFFELLPTIREISVEMIGMEQPAFTIARAFEILTSNIIALLKDSENVSLVMGAMAQTIVLVAENLDLLVTAAAAFVALKLPSYLKQISGNLKFAQRDMGALGLAQEAVLGNPEAWLEIVDNLRGLRRVSLSAEGAFEKLRAAVNSTVGRFVALFAVFESWSWAIDRINEAGQAMDRLAKQAETAAVETAKFVEQLAEIRGIDFDTAPFIELEKGFKFSQSAAERFRKEIVKNQRELAELTTTFETVFEALLGGLGLADETRAARINFLTQQIFSLQRQLESAEETVGDFTTALAPLEFGLLGTARQFDDLQKELDDFEKISKRVTAQRLKIEAEFALVGLSDIEKIPVQIARAFEDPLQRAGQAIEQSLTRLESLTRERRILQINDPGATNELEKYNAEIAKQRQVIDDAVRSVRAINTVRDQEEAGLLRQAQALARATVEQEAMAEALRLTGKEADNTFEVQLALQDLYDQGTITVNELAEALGRLDAEALGIDLDDLIKEQEKLAEKARELNTSLVDTQRSAREAQGALEAFARGGEAGLAVFERQVRLQDTFREALRQQGTTFQNATQAQLNYARAATRALEEQLLAQDKLNRAQRQSSQILEARSRIEAIGVGVTTQIADFGDISRIIDDITVEAVNGNRQAAQQLFDIAEQNLQRLAQNVQGAFGERELERAKSELKAIADLVFREPQLPAGGTTLDAEVAAAAELTVPTLVAPITFDQESLDQSVADLQTQLSQQVFTVQVEPEIVGLAIDNAVGQTVTQEGSAGAAPTL